MNYLTARNVTIGLFGWLIVNGALLAALMFWQGAAATLTTIVVGSVLAIAALLLAYLYGWEWTRYVLLVLILLVIGFTTDTNQFPPLLLAFIPAIAAVLATPVWMVGTAAVLYCLLLGRAAFAGPYADPGVFIIYASLTAIMLLARLVLERALHQAREAAAQAEAERALVTRQAAELSQIRETQDRELRRQHELLELVETLEVPGVTLADGVLFAPVVGQLDPSRIERLTARLLETVYQQRAQLVIVDLAAAVKVDGAVAQSLLKIILAVRLLGCEVAISGISAETALTLSQQEAALSAVLTVRSPQEALAAFTR